MSRYPPRAGSTAPVPSACSQGPSRVAQPRTGGAEYSQLNSKVSSAKAASHNEEQKSNQADVGTKDSRNRGKNNKFGGRRGRAYSNSERITTEEEASSQHGSFHEPSHAEDIDMIEESIEVSSSANDEVVSHGEQIVMTEQNDFFNLRKHQEIGDFDNLSEGDQRMNDWNDDVKLGKRSKRKHIELKDLTEQDFLEMIDAKN